MYKLEVSDWEEYNDGSCKVWKLVPIHGALVTMIKRATAAEVRQVDEEI